jgi:transposase
MAANKKQVSKIVDILDFQPFSWYNISMEIETKVAELEAENEQLKQLNQWLLDQLKLARKRQFGPSSEKSKLDGGEQLGLFNEAEVLADEQPEQKHVKAHTRRAAGKIGLDKLPEDLPVEVIEHDLSPEEKRCPDCGHEMHVIGRQKREELKFVPAKAVILRHEALTYACRCCEKCSDHVPVLKSPMPAPVIKGSFASPEAVAHIACEKFVMAIPLYRQEADWTRKGTPLSRQTMSNWLIRVTSDWLQPIFDSMKAELRRRQVLHADETGLQVLREEGRTPANDSYMWMYRTSCDARHHIVLYDYQPGRAGDCAAAFLKGFVGYLHTDGLRGYHCKLPPEITVVGCWAHARRNFDEALAVVPKSARNTAPVSSAIRQLGEIYKLEEEFRELPADDNFKARFEARQKRSKPLIEAFYAWCAAQPYMPKAPLTKAITYCQNQRFWLEHFLLDGRLEIDNNRAERSIKPFVIGRKNWLFCNTPSGAKASAVLYSLVETALENEVNPFDYFTFVFRNAPNWDIQNPETIERLLPWNFIPTAA